MCSLRLASGDPLALTPAFPDNSPTTPAAGPDKISQHQVTQHPQISQPRKPNSKEEIKMERETERRTITISHRCSDTVLRSGDIVRHRKTTSLFKQDMVITLEQVKEKDLYYKDKAFLILGPGQLSEVPCGGRVPKQTQCSSELPSR